MCGTMTLCMYMYMYISPPLLPSPSAVDYKVTQKSFKFAQNSHFPFYFVSVADGTNVVKVSVCCPHALQFM